MATYIPGGVDAFNSHAYALPTQQDMVFFENNSQTFFDTVGQAGQQFFGGLRDRLQTVDFGKLQEYAQAAARRVSTFWDTDNIRPLTTLVDIQFAPQTMIRWQMANPDVRAFYHKGLCAGYGDLYKDYYPGVSGHEHHDYQMVMDGMEQHDEDGDLMWVSYDEDEVIRDEDSLNYLSMSERVDIIESWNVTSKLLKEMKDDPTSRYSGML